MPVSINKELKDFLKMTDEEGATAQIKMYDQQGNVVYTSEKKPVADLLKNEYGLKVGTAIEGFSKATQQCVDAIKKFDEAIKTTLEMKGPLQEAIQGGMMEIPYSALEEPISDPHMVQAIADIDEELGTNVLEVTETNTLDSQKDDAMLEAVIKENAVLNGKPMNPLQVPLGWTITLREYPKIMWGFDDEEAAEWLDLCTEMKDFEAPPRKLNLVNTQRKWELVSAIQKSIRRGRYDVVSKLLSGCASQPSEMNYWWRRFTTTATEDIGPADITLMNMVIACEQTFCKKANYELLYPLMCFLAKKMCEGVKSRIFCSYSIIEHMPAEVLTHVKSSRLDQFYDARNAYRLMFGDAGNGMSSGAPTKRDQWMEKNNWRGEKMGGYQSMAMPLMMEQVDRQLDHVIIGGLPNYCYDMHTMIGKRCLGQMRVKSFASMQLAIPTNELSAEEQAKVLGWALFYAEGGLMDKELYDSELIAAELACVAQQFRMTQHDFSLIIKHMLLQAGNDESNLNVLRRENFKKMGYA